VFGIIAIIWTVIWFFVVRNTPEQDRWITETEKEFILKSLKSEGTQKTNLDVPWKSMFTSVPIYAIAVAHFAFTWGYYTLLTQLPTYMNDILKFDLTKTGFVSAIPYLVQTILIFISGYIADLFLVKKILTVTQVRKYFNNTSFFLQMVFLFAVAFIENTTIIIVCISCSVGLGALSMSGYLPNTIDIAPHFGSIILGMSNTVATIPGLVSPPLSGFILQTPVIFNTINILYILI
jgi:MFS transporter, ACS family, solute carrier family 17 (sodium-dependent inorganic phosphate cotransporter), other